MAVHPDPAGINPAARWGARGAFTLVEMLVAVGLVVLMMTMFATIFQIATSAMSTQKGIAENDQRVRLVINRLRNDLNGNKSDSNDPTRPFRTFRNLVAYNPDETGLPNFSATDRDGYFSISENNPDDDTDDVLSLTVQFPSTSPDQFYGQASVVLPDQTAGASYGPGNPSPGAGYPPAGSTTVPVATAPGSGQSYWPNQPDFDDVLGVPNKVGNSPYAEVCYFLRKGTLYRRVLLIRSPNVTPTPVDGTPRDSTATQTILNLSTYTSVTRTFWNDFDYSAYFDTLHLNELRFHGAGTTTSSLSYAAAFANPLSLGNPAYRFGFDQSTTTSGGIQIPSTTYGQPREFVKTPAGGIFFIGRFTHGDTSDLTFGYPGSVLQQSYGNPMSLGTTLNYDVASGRVGPPGNLFAGPRIGEDILMTNVLKFDIKVFDPAASAGPDGAPGIAGIDDDGDGVTDGISEIGWPGSDDGDFVDLGHRGTSGFYASPSTATTVDFDKVANTLKTGVFGPTNVPVIMRAKILGVPPAPLPGTYNSFTKYVYPNTTYNSTAGIIQNPNRFDTWNPSLNFDNDLDSATNTDLFDCPPYRPFTFGQDSRPGAANFDDDGNGAIDFVTDGNGVKHPDPREIGWPGTDDVPYALGAIQIKIAFLDPTSNQIREVTFVQSLLYTP